VVHRDGLIATSHARVVEEGRGGRVWTGIRGVYGAIDT
jgi:hypothetical protein